MSAVCPQRASADQCVPVPRAQVDGGLDRDATPAIPLTHFPHWVVTGTAPVPVRTPA